MEPWLNRVDGGYKTPDSRHFPHLNNMNPHHDSFRRGTLALPREYQDFDTAALMFRVFNSRKIGACSVILRGTDAHYLADDTVATHKVPLLWFNTDGSLAWDEQDSHMLVPERATSARISSCRRSGKCASGRSRTSPTRPRRGTSSGSISTPIRAGGTTASSRSNLKTPTKSTANGRDTRH